MDLLQTLLIYMSLVFASSVQTAPEPSEIPADMGHSAAYVQTTPMPTSVATPVPTINITPNPSYKTLQMGDRGANVRAMQEKLQEYGYYTGEIDGAYGNQSRMAVEQFQYMHGLTVDGIAGRHTLTVLFESEEIRLPQQGVAVSPTPETKLAVAITPTPSPELAVTAIPVLTATPVPTRTPEPTTVPLPVRELEGYGLKMNDSDVQAKLFMRGETIYLPVVEVLKNFGVNVISSVSVEMDEYAFAYGMNLIRFTHTEDQYGSPIDLQVYCNNQPQLVPDRSLHQADGVLYMPMTSLESMSGLKCTVDEEKKLIIVSETQE